MEIIGQLNTAMSCSGGGDCGDCGGGGFLKHPNLTALFKGPDVPTEVPM